MTRLDSADQELVELGKYSRELVTELLRVYTKMHNLKKSDLD